MSSLGGRFFRNKGGFGGLESIALGAAVAEHGLRNKGYNNPDIGAIHAQGNVAYTLAEQAQKHAIDQAKLKSGLGRSEATHAKGLQERHASFLNGMSKNSEGFHDHTFMTENSPTIKDATNATIKVTKAAASIAERMDDPPKKPTPQTPAGWTPKQYPSQSKATPPGMKPKRKPPTQGTLF